jgi:CRP/FNR family transcriptional regulator/CRP/FNR family cyclic AMP-dependent transcriptional regulator
MGLSNDQPPTNFYARMDRVEFLRHVPLFTELSDSELQAIAPDLVRQAYHQGDTIFYQGDVGQTLYIVESGQIRVYVQSEDGQETSVNVCGPGDLFGEFAVIDGLPRSASAVSMEDSVLLSLHRDHFYKHLRSFPQLALSFMKTLSVRLRYNTRQVDSLAALNVPARLARKLLELGQNHGVIEPDGVHIHLALTQSDLASLIGATRESINKALGSFRKQGYIRQQRGQIVIVDPEALRDLNA